MGASATGQGQGLLPTARQANQKAGNPLLRAGQEAKLKQATRMYEAHFIATLWKEMRKSGSKNSLLNGGYGEEIFTGLLDQARSEAMSQGAGMGIAAMLERQLSRQGQSPPSRAASTSGLKPLAWKGRMPTAQGDDETEAEAVPQDPAQQIMDSSGDASSPLIELAPVQAAPEAISSVTLPVPQGGEDEESASTAWPPAPVAGAPLVRAATRAAQDMEPPVQGAVTSTFGLRLHPITGDIRPHQGLDLAAPSGTPVKAALSGVVRFAGTAGDYGRLVVVEHDDGSSTFYGHCKSLSVTPGQRVAQGQMVARVGMTGQATGPHLHFEVRDAAGQARDPLPMVAGRLNTTS